MNEVLVKYGFPGIVIAGMAWFILYLMKEHKKERKEYLQTSEKQFDRLNQITDDSNKVTRENTNILQGLKALLENENRRK
jgi:hypothetical protein